MQKDRMRMIRTKFEKNPIILEEFSFQIMITGRLVVIKADPDFSQPLVTTKRPVITIRS